MHRVNVRDHHLQALKAPRRYVDDTFTNGD